MKPAQTFQDLIVWQKAHQFVLEYYRLTGAFPGEERCGLTSQLRRAAVSIPANITEGFKKRGDADKGRFMNIAQGSVEKNAGIISSLPATNVMRTRQPFRTNSMKLAGCPSAMPQNSCLLSPDFYVVHIEFHP